LFIFRRPAAVLLTASGPILGVLWTAGLMGWAGERINGLNSVIPTIVLVIGFTDAVHLMIDYRQERREGRKGRESAALAIKNLGLPCLLTALTTAIGFGSMICANTMSVQRFGIFCGLGTLTTFIAGVTLFPLLASTRLGDVAYVAARPGEESRHHWLRRIVLPSVNHPRLATAVVLVVCLAMAPSPFRLLPDIQWTEAIPPDGQTSLAIKHCDKAFGGALLTYVVVEWPEGLDLARPEVIETTRAVHECLTESDMLRGPFSVLNLLETLPGKRADLTDRSHSLARMPPKVVERFVRADLRQLVVTAHVPDVGAARLVPSLEKLDRKLAEIAGKHPGFNLHLTGTAVVAARNVSAMVSDLGNSLGLEAVAVFLLMSVGFRSVYLGVMSMIPNLFPLLITASALVWTGQPLTLTSALAFNLCLGLAVDDTIHFLLRLDRERKVDGDLRAAVLRTFDAMGTVMVTTTPILIGGFGALFFNEMPAVRSFAYLSCVTLIAALLGDLLVLPALLLCFARRPAPLAPESVLRLHELKRHHPRVRVSR
jgi:hypothetical protein